MHVMGLEHRIQRMLLSIDRYHSMYISQPIITWHIAGTQKSLLTERKPAGFVSQTTAGSKQQEMIANSFRRAYKFTKRESRHKNLI